MPWTAKWIAAIVVTFVLLVVADRIWYVQEMKALAGALGVDWSKIERRGTFPYEHYKKIVHYGMTREDARKILIKELEKDFENEKSRRLAEAEEQIKIDRKSVV